MDKHTKT